MWFIALLFKNLFAFPLFIYYQVYDHCIYHWYNKKRLFPGWGIHLFTGKFGQGKTSLMTIKAYKLALKYQFHQSKPKYLQEHSIYHLQFAAVRS